MIVLRIHPYDGPWLTLGYLPILVYRYVRTRARSPR